jgi:uncharacterized lipoprotein YmbA
MRFYTLTAIAPDMPPAVAPDTAPVRLNRVTVPGEVDRAQLVRRIDATRLQIDEQGRWAAPLDEMIRRVLTINLAARLSPNLVADANESGTGERLQALSVDIQEFYPDASCAVTLRATWVLTPPQPQGARAPGGQARGRQVSEEIHVPASGTCSGSDAIPEPMSRALAQLSDHIAAGVARPAEVAR